MSAPIVFRKILNNSLTPYLASGFIIYLEVDKKDGTFNEAVYGEDPAFIASTAIERGLVSRLDHAAYLGRELEKAYLSMRHGFQYVQDSAPGKQEPDGKT